MEDVETFMLLQVELYLKVVPLDWIIFSVILGNLTDEDNEIYMLSIPSTADAGLSLMLVGTLASSTSCTETDKVSGSVMFPSNINMQIKTNKHYCVCELKLHIMLYQFTKFAAISPFCTGSAAALCVITGHFVATN